jgi:hypothetical protein
VIGRLSTRARSGSSEFLSHAERLAWTPAEGSRELGALLQHEGLGIHAVTPWISRVNLPLQPRLAIAPSGRCSPFGSRERSLLHPNAREDERSQLQRGRSQAGLPA